MSQLTPLCCILLLVLQVTPVCAELTPDFLMQSDPPFRALPLVKDFQKDFAGIWLLALQRPEVDYQRKAAETVARAHAYGIPNLTQLVPQLETILTAKGSHRAARYAAARALIVLEARDSAAKLLQAGLDYGSELRQLVEPALAQWDFIPARAVWNQRLESAQTFPRDLVLALRGLGQVRESNALPAISKIAIDPLRPSNVRLEAAKAAGEITESGLEADADKLAHDRTRNPLINRLCAVQFLARHTSEPARSILIELGHDAEPSLAAAALRRLNEIDPELGVPLAEDALRSADPQVREAGANSYIKRPSQDRIVSLAKLLDDDHPSLRSLVGENMYRLAENSELNDAIRAESMRILWGNRWQGQLQATLVLGMLDHKPAADRFVELLESPRADVRIHAAWGLRKLAEPRTIPVIVEKIRGLNVERNQRRIPGVDEQLAHLFEAAGVMMVKDLEPLMLELVPKDLTRTADFTRSAAIWALGRLHAGTLDSPLADALMERVLDNSLRPPESPLVKRMSIVTLVRMKAVSYSPSLKKSFATHEPGTEVDLAARWAVHELTGEDIPPPTPRSFPEGAWFLEPLGPSAAN